MNRFSRLFALLCLSFLILCTETSFAKLENGNGSAFAIQTTEQGFDATAANKALNLLQINASPGRANLKELQAALVLLNKFQLQARKCVELNTLQLDKLRQRLTEISATPDVLSSKDTALTEEQKYLNNKKEELSHQLSECRLFALRAEDIGTDLTEKLQNLVTTRLLYAHPTIFQNIKNFPTQAKKTWESFDMTVFMDNSGLTYFNDENIPLLLLPLFVVFAFFYTHNRLKKKIIYSVGDATTANFSLQFKQAFISIASRYLPIFSAALILTLFFSLFTHSLITPSYFAYTCYAFLVYICVISLVRFYFYPPAPAEGLTKLPKDTAKILAKLLKKFCTLCFVTYLIYLFSSDQTIARPIADLFRTLILTLISFNFIAIIWTLQNSSTARNQHAILRLCISVVSILLFLFIIIVEWLGYQLMASYVLSGTIMTVIVTFATRLIGRVMSTVLDNLRGTEHLWQQKLHRSFGLKRHEQLIEMLWLRGLFYIILWIGFLVALLKIWGLAQANFQKFVNYLVYGANIGTLRIVPLRIAIGALFFIMLVLATRWFRTYIAKANWHLEAASRESLASIFGYIGFAIAFLLGALIAGVNFSGLALIASALALGIGIGLQNIVSNFASGIILLVERPVKLGDRIIIGKTEGYVKKISIRSTRIMTTQLSDVIVPNSELITQQVTNYMLHDLYYKISTAVGIEYGSDTELAKNILLSIAKTHPLVVSDRKDLEPAVYFRAFGENSLDFALYCVIKDVNMKFDVVSDLNFAIDKAFNEKGIKIASPQREIKVTQWPQNLPPPAS